MAGINNANHGLIGVLTNHITKWSESITILLILAIDDNNIWFVFIDIRNKVLIRQPVKYNRSLILKCYIKFCFVIFIPTNNPDSLEKRIQLYIRFLFEDSISELDRLSELEKALQIEE